MWRNSDAVQGGFVAIVGSIYEQGVEQAVPWLMATDVFGHAGWHESNSTTAQIQ